MESRCHAVPPYQLHDSDVTETSLVLWGERKESERKESQQETVTTKNRKESQQKESQQSETQNRKES